MVTAVGERRDLKAGASTKCRSGLHTTCKSLGLVCQCECHGPGGQQPSGVKEKPVSPAPLKSVETAPDTSRGLIWETPPAHGGRRQPVEPSTITALRSRPGEWARVRTWPGRTSANTYATSMRRHPDLYLPTGCDLADFEVKASKKDDGSALYMRFVGDAETDR